MARTSLLAVLEGLADGDGDAGFGVGLDVVEGLLEMLALLESRLASEAATGEAGGDSELWL